MSEPMSDERLAEIRELDGMAPAIYIRERPRSAIAHRHELLLEVERLTAENARLLEGLRDRPVTWVCTCGRMNSGPSCDFCPRTTTLPEQLLAVKVRQPVTITTAEELRALLVGAVLLDKDGDSWQIWQSGGELYAQGTGDTSTLRLDSDRDVATLLVYAPFTVLHQPTPGSAG